MLVVAAAATLFTSCSKDDETSDVRTQAVGAYVIATQTYFIAADGSLVTGSNGEDLDFDAVEIKKGNSATEINIYNSEGDLFLIGSSVKEVQQGFVFNINTQTYDDVTFEGYPYFTLTTGESYDALFTASDKTFDFSLVIDVDGNGEISEGDTVMVFSGAKVE